MQLLDLEKRSFDILKRVYNTVGYTKGDMTERLKVLPC